MAKTLEDVYAAARALIENGWTQGVLYETGFTAFCSEGAIIYAIWGGKAFKNNESLSAFVARDDQDQNYSLYQDAMHGLAGIVHDYVHAWNDSGFTKQSDVIEAFNKAIEEYS